VSVLHPGVILATTAGERAELIFFIILAPLAVVSALGMVLNRNAVYSALLLVVNFFCLAAFYVFLQAQFLAAVQVIVYAGAIVVLFLFVIMLLGVDKADDLSIEPFPIQRPLAAVVGIGLAGLVIAAIVRARDRIVEGTPLDSAGDANIRQLADNLFQDWVFAFEFTSVLLIVAVVGTVVLARRTKPDPTSKAGDE
jgi:NADH-quinone oxidoreductase subunit J